MKIVNRLIVLGIIVAGAWFFSNQWNKNQNPVVVPEGTEAVEVVTEEPGEETVAEEVVTEEVKVEVAEVTAEPVIEEKQVEEIKTVETPAVKVESTPAVVKPVVKTEAPKVVVPAVKETPTKVYDQIMSARNNEPASMVSVYLYEWEVDMLNDVIPSGDVSFIVHNSGIFTHDFTLDGVESFGKVKPGFTKQFDINLAPGMYDIVSPREQDIKNGMWHSLLVE